MKQKWLTPPSITDGLVCQREMAELIDLTDSLESAPRFVAGMDVSCRLYDPKQMIFAAVVILSYPELSVVEVATHAQKQEFPYVPGLLGFREAPALVSAFQKLSIYPDVILVDGQGTAHPRKLGVASHLGVLLDIPTIGVAKSILVGSPKQPLGQEAGSQTSLIWKEQEIGMCVRTKRNCNPLIISPGHKISLSTSFNLVMGCSKGYRLPEPTRHAHLAANECRVNNLSH